MTFGSPENITNLNSTLSYIHYDLTSQKFFPVLLLTVFLIILISQLLSSHKRGIFSVIAVSFFVCMPIVIILFYLNYITLFYVIVNLIGLGLAYVLAIFFD